MTYKCSDAVSLALKPPVVCFDRRMDLTRRALFWPTTTTTTCIDQARSDRTVAIQVMEATGKQGAQIEAGSD